MRSYECYDIVSCLRRELPCDFMASCFGYALTLEICNLQFKFNALNTTYFGASCLGKIAFGTNILPWMQVALDASCILYEYVALDAS